MRGMDKTLPMRAMIPFPDISPELFSFSLFGVDIALRWYALAYIVGIIIGWRLIVMALRRPKPMGHAGGTDGCTASEDLLTWVILGVILGGRLGYVLFYKPAYYLANPTEILVIWQGGMSFHGGFLGVVIAAWIWSGRQNVPRLSLADTMALGVAPGVFLGRIANFINAELWGRPTDLPWGVAFPGYYAQECGQAVGEICARHPSQLYEALLEGLILGGLLIHLAFRRGALKRPGVIAGIFFAGYGIARFLVEFVRQPDAQFISPGNPLALRLKSAAMGLRWAASITADDPLWGLVGAAGAA